MNNQKGVSMVSLVITIIVIIILAAVAFSGSQETIGRAGFSGYTTDIDSVRTAFLTEGVTNLIGSEAAKNNTVTEAQAYNYLAKGATTAAKASVAKNAWLSKAQANAIPATRIEKEFAKEAIGIELPKRTVNTYGATGVEIEYFVTNKGDIFTWPPYFRSDDGLFYVNDTTPVKSVEFGLISGENEKEMYADGFRFVVNDVVIKVASGDSLMPLKPDVTTQQLKEMASVIYLDKRNPDQPEGVETDEVYQDNGVVEEIQKAIISFTIAGVTYNAEEDMTWGDWVENETYNTLGLGENMYYDTILLYEGDVFIGNVFESDGYTYVHATDIIMRNHDYKIEESPRDPFFP